MATAEPASVLPPTNLPEPVSELIGRDDELERDPEPCRRASARHPDRRRRHRQDTTRPSRSHASCCRNLPTGCGSPSLAPSPIPSWSRPPWLPRSGCDLGGGEASAQRVAQALADRQLLLVLDNCEHVIDAAAAMAEAMLRGRLGACISSPPAASRSEREGEWVYPVPPLAVPAADVAADDDPLQYGARSAVRRAGARGRATLRAGPAHVAMIAAICRRLDGIPLAIELAAARAAALGIEALAARLDDRFRLLTGGRRTALPRHQTLRATLDWSYELLAEPERVILRRLAVFAGAFSLEAAGAVAASPETRGVGRRRGRFRAWSRNRSSRRRATAPSRATGCSTRRAPMRSKSSSESGERDAARAPSRRILPGSLRAGRSRMGDAAHGRMAGRLRARDRQSARGARLGLFAGR